jgi:hypothetical protein
MDSTQAPISNVDNVTRKRIHTCLHLDIYLLAEDGNCLRLKSIYYS